MLLNLISFVFVLGIAVLIHELGHFIFAKRAGIYCYEFAIGMGPKLWSTQKGETVYSIRAIPIGGYVQMAGEGVEEDKNLPKDRLFQSKTWWQRFMTIFAGPLFNFILSITLIFIILFAVGVPKQTNILSKVNEDYPAYEAGLREGDKIVAINNEIVEDFQDLFTIVNKATGQSLDVTYERNGQTNTVVIEPRFLEDENRFVIGIESKVDYERIGLLESIKGAFVQTYGFIVQMFTVIGMLISGEASLKSMAGPVGIYTIVGQQAQAGIYSLLFFTAFLSVNLGFMNLLPIPALDGGRLIFLFIEGIIRKPINPDLENKIHAIGLALLMLLFVFVTFNDILRLFS